MRQASFANGKSPARRRAVAAEATGAARAGRRHPHRRARDGDDYRFAVLEVLELTVGLAYDVPASALRSRTRGRAHVALARQVAMYLAHVVYGQSLTDVGALFGRDRTTVAHACGIIEDRRDDPCFDRSMDRLEGALNSFAAAPAPPVPSTAFAKEAAGDAR